MADDWPFTYADLEKFYDENDQIMGVSGISGDPGNPPRARRPMPPLPPGAGAERLGPRLRQPRLALVGVRHRHQQPDISRPRRLQSLRSLRYGLPVRARASADITYWPLALEAGARLITGARVFEVTTDAGRAGDRRCLLR